MFLNKATIQVRRGLTLLEIVVAVSIMTIVMAAILPQFRAIYMGWDARTQGSEVVQNVRVLSEHLKMALSTATKITIVSEPDVLSGFIEFEKGDKLTYRLDVSDDGYIRYGTTDNMSELAGPASELRFECYALDDLTQTTTELDRVRLVKVFATVFSLQDPSREYTYESQIFLRVNSDIGSHLAGWYKFDDTEGNLATDSSIHKNHGLLMNYESNKWSPGMVGGALYFDGDNDYIQIQHLDTENSSVTISAWCKLEEITGAGAELITIGDAMALRLDSWFYPGTAGFYYNGASWPMLLTEQNYSMTGWHHYAYVLNWENKKQTIYVDGELVKQGPYTQEVVWHEISELTKIGTHIDPTYTWYFLKGYIDDVRIYNFAMEEVDIEQICPPPPMHHWKLDEDNGKAIDSVGSLDGICKSGVAQGLTSVNDQLLNCVNLDGTNDWIDLGQSNDLDSLKKEFSVSAWIRPLVTSWPAWIFGKDTQDSNWSLGIDDSNIILMLWNKRSFDFPYSVPMNAWSHLTVIFTKDNDAILFVNGQYISTVAGKDNAKGGKPGTGWAIGRCDDDGYFNGFIDDVRVFDYSLTDTQVLTVSGQSALTDPFLTGDVAP